MAQGSMARWLSAAAIIGVAIAGCNSNGGNQQAASRQRPVQAAVGSAVRQISQSRATPAEPSNADPTLRSHHRETLALPSVAVTGSGQNARLQVRGDERHESPSVVRTPEGFAVTWGDHDHDRVVLARVDERGRALGAPIVVRESGTDEEDVWAPSVAFTGQEFGVAWADPANGRVRFARHDADGRALGPATIIHEGLEMPLATRVVWNGSEFAVAVAEAQGIYFARVDRNGNRVGEGTILAEGATVATLDELSANSNGFVVAWRDGEGASARRLRLTREGRPMDTTGFRHTRHMIGRLARR